MINPNFSTKEKIKQVLTAGGQYTEKQLSDLLQVSLTRMHRILKILIKERSIFFEVTRKCHPKKFPTKIYFIHKPKTQNT